MSPVALTPMLFVVASLLSAALLVIVLRSSDGSRSAKVLATLLAFQALGSSIWLGVILSSPPRSLALAAIGNVVYAWIHFTYVVLLATLDTPITRPLRRRPALAVAALLTGIPPTINLVYFFLAARDIDITQPGFNDPRAIGFQVPFVTTLAIGLLAVVAAVWAFRRAASGSPARRRARAWMIAFGVRDFIPIIAIWTSIAIGPVRAAEATAPIWPLADILFVPLLAYGILTTRLFDIDLRIKLGISRGTVASIILVAVFVGAKIVESYLNRTAGFVAGSVVAGALLFLVPRLNKVGEKVANAAMPGVQPTSGYVQFKKLEVYRAAVEAAHETGGIGDRERASLGRLAAKLALDGGDCAAVEAEVRGAG